MPARLFLKSETPAWRLMLVATLVELLLAVGLILCGWLTGSHGAESIAAIMQAIVAKRGLITLGVLVCFLGPLLEEGLFRGLLPWGLERARLPRPIAVLTASIVWGAGHYASPAQALFTALSGVNYCVLRFRSGSLMPGLALHIASNSLLFAILVLGGDFDA
jgi:membrane protease YdiL (CAAX protease family)